MNEIVAVVLRSDGRANSFVAIYMASQQFCIDIKIIIPNNEVVLVSGNLSTAEFSVILFFCAILNRWYLFLCMQHGYIDCNAFLISCYFSSF